MSWTEKDERQVTKARDEIDAQVLPGAENKHNRKRQKEARNTLNRVLRRHEGPAPGTRPWTWEQMLAYSGVGWLKRGVPNRWPVYNMDMLLMGRTDFTAIADDISRAANGRRVHSPFILENNKHYPGAGFPTYDVWGDPELVGARLKYMVGAGIVPVLFLGSDKAAGEQGMGALIAKLEAIWPAIGHLIGGVCPRIEMDEAGRPHDVGVNHGMWERWATGINSIIGPEVPLWCHFLQDMYWKPEGYDGILYQHKRIGHDGVFRRGAHEHRHEIGNDEEYHGPQDRSPWGSPLRGAIHDGWQFVSFEWCQEPDDTEQDYEDVKAGIIDGFNRVGVEPRVG